MEYGYIRVSTKEQNEQRQLLAMREFGIDEKQIYMDKQSGEDFECKKYKRMIRKLKNGDTLVVKSIDRLGRNSGAMAVHNQGKAGSNLCAGYATPGY